MAGGGGSRESRSDVATDNDPTAIRERYRFERDKRLRAPHKGKFQSLTGRFSSFADDPFVESRLEREPMFDEVDVVVVGGGISGLTAAARLREAGLERVRIVDRAADVGGVWYWNRYPGAQCDTESYIYLPLLEETGYMPKEKYSFQPEIFEQCQRIATQYGLYEFACFETGVEEVRWDDHAGCWRISTDRGDRMRARFIVLANGGSRSTPQLPGIPGILTFEGHAFHTSRWDVAYTGRDLSGLEDKKVGIIGTAATAVQCVPRLAVACEQLYVFQRTPAAPGVRNNRPTDAAWASSLEPGWQYERMMNFDIVIAKGQYGEDLVNDGWTEVFKDDTARELQIAGDGGLPLEVEEMGGAELLDLALMQRIRDRVDQTVTDPETREKLKPYYGYFCKRPLFHDLYLASFNRPNVTLVDTDGNGPDEVTATGVVVGGELYEVDCLVFATGFEPGGFLRQADYDVIGRNSQSLAEAWADGPRTLHGLQVHGFPNCFLLAGVTQVAASLNHCHSAHQRIEHITFLIKHCHDNGIRVIEATEEAAEHWVRTMHEKQKFNREYFEACTPGLVNGFGNLDSPDLVTSELYGGGVLEFFSILREWRESGTFSGVQLGPGGA